MSELERIDVLHVDADPEFAEMAATVLEREDDRFNIETAMSASEGLDRLSDDGFDCIISDHDMPDKNGVEFLSTVRETYPDLPFILYTGTGSEEVASDAISAGVTDYLQKGNGTDQYTALANRVRNAVKQYRATQVRESGLSGRDHETELQLKTRAMDEAPVGITITDPSKDDNPLIYVNEHFSELTGYDPAEIIGQNCRFLQGEDTDPDPVSEMRGAIDAAERVTVELRNYRKDGTEFWNQVRIAPVRDEAGDVSHFVGFQLDITERKEYADKLKEERTFIEQCLDALEDVFYVFDSDGEILRWNSRLSEVTGYGDEELATMEPTDFFPDDHVPRIAKAVEDVLETGQATVQADILTTDGERIPHEFTGFRLTDSEGGETGFAGIGRDLRQRREYEHQLEQRNERLEEFASIVSHDLRNPLNVARGHLELAHEECDSTHLESVAEAHARIDELIDELLTLAKEGTIALNPEAVSLADLGHASWQTAVTGGATLSIDQEVTIRADENRLRQLFENLFRNAADHGGDVTVRIGTLDEGDGFYVADDGPGIPETDRTHVFESGVTTSEEGIGAGLSIVKRVADAHGWEIDVVESESGGARFEFTGVEFPAA